MKRREFLKNAGILPVAGLPLLATDIEYPTEDGQDYPDGPWAPGWEQRCGCDDVIYRHLVASEEHKFCGFITNAALRLKNIPIPGTLVVLVFCEDSKIASRFVQNKQGILEFNSGATLQATLDFSKKKNTLKLTWKDRSPKHTVLVEYEYDCIGVSDKPNPKNLPVVKFESSNFTARIAARIANIDEIFAGIEFKEGKRLVKAWIRQEDIVSLYTDVYYNWWGEVLIEETKPSEIVRTSIIPTPDSFKIEQTKKFYDQFRREL
jgi:hypothetical protein